jgi:hypothetical protein
VVVLVAGHRADNRTDGRIRIYDLTQGLSDLVTAVDFLPLADDRGRVCQVAYLGPATAIQPGWVDGNQMAAAWVGAGGQVYRDTSLERVGDVLRWALQRSSIPVDWRRTEPVCRSFDWPVGGYWDERTAPWDWVRNNLLSILPVTVVYGPQGAYLVRLDRPTRDRAILHLRDGLGCCVTGRTVDVDGVVDSASLAYAIGQKGEARLSYTLQADRPAGRGQGQTIPSQQRRALRGPSSWSQRSGIVWSDVTAGLVCQAQLSMRSPRSSVEIDCGETAKSLNIGSVISVSSTRYSLDSRPAIVRAIRRESSRVKISAVVYSRS